MESEQPKERKPAKKALKISLIYGSVIFIILVVFFFISVGFNSEKDPPLSIIIYSLIAALFATIPLFLSIFLSLKLFTKHNWVIIILLPLLALIFSYFLGIVASAILTISLGSDFNGQSLLTLLLYPFKMLGL